MVVLGFLLALAAAGVGIGFIVENSSPASLSLFGQHVPGITSEGQVFAAGVLVAFVFLLGLAVTVMTTGRAIRRRRELRDLREEHQESLTTLEIEKQRLQRELARVRQAIPAGMDSSSGARTAGAPPSVAPVAGTTPSGAPAAGMTPPRARLGDQATLDDVRVAPRQTPSRSAMSASVDRPRR